MVVGCGSIGERHIRSFLATGRAGMTACDNRPLIRKEITEKYGVESFADWEAAVQDPAISGVVIATPAPLHVPIMLAAFARGLHVLVEKPLALKAEPAAQLTAARDRVGKFAAVAYTYHCLPALVAARAHIHSGACGMIRHATVTCGQHFPTFRPAYREIYYRDHAQGGGAIQDFLTHMANAMEWVLGPTDRLYCDASHQVLDGVQVEDTVMVAARNGGCLVSYAVNQFQAPNETRWDFHGERGSVRVELHAGRWGVQSLGETEWTWHAAPLDNRDVMFVAQANAFLDGCEGNLHPLCTLEEGLQTLRFNVAALESWRTNQPVSL